MKDLDEYLKKKREELAKLKNTQPAVSNGTPLTGVNMLKDTTTTDTLPVVDDPPKKEEVKSNSLFDKMQDTFLNKFNVDTGYTPQSEQDLEQRRLNALTNPDAAMDFAKEQANYQRARDNQEMLKKSELTTKYLEEFRTPTGEANPNVTYKMRDIARNTSNYYRKYCLADESSNMDWTDEDWNNVAAKYMATYELDGVDAANQWLNQAIKDEIATNQTGWDKLSATVRGIGSEAFGSIVTGVGIAYGLSINIGNIFRSDENDVGDPNRNGWQVFWDNIIDNDVTRYGNDVITYGSWRLPKIEAAKALGLSNTEILNTSEQDQKIIHGNTPWELAQQGGYTIASIIEGFGLGKGAQLLFKGARKGITSTAKGLNMTAAQMEKVEGLIKALNKGETYVNRIAVPGYVGQIEGAQNAFQTKESIQRSGYEKIKQEYDQLIQDKIGQEFTIQYNEGGDPIIYDKQGHLVSNEDYIRRYKEIENEYKPMLQESYDEVDYEAAWSANGTFLINSIINGYLNASLKSLQLPTSVQESLRGSKFTGWAQPKPKIKISGTPGNAKVTSSMSVGQKIVQGGKEMVGEGLEEIKSNLTGDTFEGHAEYTIDEYIRRKYDADVMAGIGENFAGTWGASMAALGESLKSKETWKSGVYGSLSAAMGTFKVSGYRAADGSYWGQGMKADGTRETKLESNIRRFVPWRSGLWENIKDVQMRDAAGKANAAELEEWLNNPTNAAKFNGVVGSASWAWKQDYDASMGDEFAFRNDVLGKNVNDLLTIEKLKGTEYYNSLMNNIQRVANVNNNSEDASDIIEAYRAQNPESTKEDSEILDIVREKSKEILELQKKISETSEDIDTEMGDISDDVKQSLIFSRLANTDWTERADKLNKEIFDIYSKVKENSTSGEVYSDEEKNVIANYGGKTQVESAIKDLKHKIEDAKVEIDSVQDAVRKVKSSKGVSLKARMQLAAGKKQAIAQLKGDIKTYKKQLTEAEKAAKTLEDGKSYVLSESDIMSLDPETRAKMLLKGSATLYNAMHVSDESKRKEIPSPYSEAQTTIIRDIVNRASNQNTKFLDKVVDLGRIFEAKGKYARQSIAIMSDKKSFGIYVNKIKQQQADKLAQKRVQGLNEIKDYNQFKDAYVETIRQSDLRTRDLINRTLSQNPNYQRYKQQITHANRIMEKVKYFSTRVGDISSELPKDVDLALSYLLESNVDLTDMEAVERALLEIQDDNSLAGYSPFVDYARVQTGETNPDAHIYDDEFVDRILIAIKQANQEIKEWSRVSMSNEDTTGVTSSSEQSATQQSSTIITPTSQEYIEEIDDDETKEERDNLRESVKINDYLRRARNSIKTMGETLINKDPKNIEAVTQLIETINGIINEVEQSSDFKSFATFLNELSAKANELSISSEKVQRDSGIFLLSLIEKSDTNRDTFGNMQEDDTPGNVLMSVDLNRLNPEYTIAQYMAKHRIDEFMRHRKGLTMDTPIYFFTDDSLTQDTKDSLAKSGKRDYTDEGDLPIVIAVKLTAFDGNVYDDFCITDDNGTKYQVIGVMPSTANKTDEASVNIQSIRTKALSNKDLEGTHLITWDNGKPITTTPAVPHAGFAIGAKSPKGKVEDKITHSLISSMEALVKDLPEKTAEVSLEQQLNEYIDSLTVSGGQHKQLAYQMPNYKGMGTNNPEALLIKPITRDQEATTNTTDESGNTTTTTTTLEEALQSDNPQALLNFNYSTRTVLKKVTKFIEDFKGIAAKFKEEAQKNAIPVTNEALLARFSAKTLKEYVSKGIYSTYEFEVNPDTKSLIITSDRGETIEISINPKELNAENLAYQITKFLLESKLNDDTDTNSVTWQIDYEDIDVLRTLNANAQGQSKQANAIREKLKQAIKEGIIQTNSALQYTVGSIAMHTPTSETQSVDSKPQTSPEITTANAIDNTGTINGTITTEDDKLDLNTQEENAESNTNKVDEDVLTFVKENYDKTLSEIFDISATLPNNVVVVPAIKEWRNGQGRNVTMRVYFKDNQGNPDESKGYFELVADIDFKTKKLNNEYSVHFKTGNPNEGKPTTSTSEERKSLYSAIQSLIPEGALVSTWGEVSRGGLIALDKVGNGFTKLEETRAATDREGNPIQLPIYRKESSQKANEEPTESSTNTSTSQETLDPELEEIKKDAIKKGIFMKAPNGEPTKLTEKQWLQVRTKAFKEWFGDWENDPANASKIIDENGEPLAVYHGGDKGITIFNKEGRVSDGYLPTANVGFFFTDNEKNAKSYSAHRKIVHKVDTTVYGVFLNIKNPLYFSSIHEFRQYMTSPEFVDYNEDGDMISKRVIDENYDGVIITKVNDSDNAKEFVARKANQIKSATDNSGKFNTNSNNIYDDEQSNTSAEATQEEKRDIVEEAVQALDQPKESSFSSLDDLGIFGTEDQFENNELDDLLSEFGISNETKDTSFNSVNASSTMEEHKYDCDKK